ncbi:hypothetical protein HNR39_002477 [Glaciimonas immobilis]|uniref:Uncharacterized protein n=1 Tax=Glaciimonas immobilis TaxID=728004 RepID=A0A840RS76_9BURK|nr:hypothetical protein [Glaciimonas immobilis]
MPKTVTPLTDMQAKSAKSKDKSYKLADGGDSFISRR